MHFFQPVWHLPANQAFKIHSSRKHRSFEIGFRATGGNIGLVITRSIGAQVVKEQQVVRLVCPVVTLATSLVFVRTHLHEVHTSTLKFWTISLVWHHQHILGCWHRWLSRYNLITHLCLKEEKGEGAQLSLVTCCLDLNLLHLCRAYSASLI